MKPTPEELRKWSAEVVMGWFYCGIQKEISTFSTKEEYEGEIYDKIFSIDWRPDDLTIGQIWMFVERMRGLGWQLLLENSVNDDNIYATFYIPFAGLLDEKLSLQGIGIDPNPCLAILLAGYEAWKGGGKPHENNS